MEYCRFYLIKSLLDRQIALNFLLKYFFFYVDTYKISIHIHFMTCSLFLNIVAFPRICLFKWYIQLISNKNYFMLIIIQRVLLIIENIRVRRTEITGYRTDSSIIFAARQFISQRFLLAMLVNYE